jgi:hypothetical protein
MFVSAVKLLALTHAAAIAARGLEGRPAGAAAAIREGRHGSVHLPMQS